MSEPLAAENLTPDGTRGSLTADAWRALRTSPRFWFAAFVIVVITLMALWPQAFVAPSPATHDPRDCSLRADDGSFQDRLPPSAEHWFGTDVQGCDYYARVMYGARVSVVVGVGATLLALAIGLALGGVAGYYRGWPDSVISRVTDLFFALPYVVGAILLLTVLGEEGRSAFQVLLVIGVLSWPLASRIVRSSVLSVAQQEYIEAARAVGASDARILTRHVLPNSFAPVFVYSMISIGAIIGVEATLSFLGVGLRLPAISWGLMINTAQGHLLETPHLLLFPGLFVTLIVLAFLLMGDALRDAFDPRLLR
jgi:ABC-type dipeptide/oligopeptide/nickel transport system permease subunit